jgi:hypothetical protein
VAVVLALTVEPPAALGVLICSMMLYPDYLRVPVGPVKMSVPRFVALALVVWLVFSPRRRMVRWRLIDALVGAEWVWNVVANVLAGAGQVRLSEVVGRIFDSVVFYFAARLCIVRREELRKLVRPLALCLVMLGGLAASEAITRRSPYQFLRRYSDISGFDFENGAEEGALRYGFMRAQVATSNSIYFGMAAVSLAGLMYALRGFSGGRRYALFGCIAGLVAAVSSVSSGPLSSVMLLVVLCAFERFPRLIRPGVIGLICFLIFAEIASNRHVWYLIEYINPASGDSWYRSQLITVAIRQWRDYWLIGVGSHSVNDWGMLVDGRMFVDLVNEYVLVAISSGFLGLFLRLAIQYTAVRDNIWTYRHSDAAGRHFGFALAATTITAMLGGLSVGLFGPPLLLMYLLIGLSVRRPGDSAVTRYYMVRRDSTPEAAEPPPTRKEAAKCSG